MVIGITLEVTFVVSELVFSRFTGSTAPTKVDVSRRPTGLSLAPKGLLKVLVEGLRAFNPEWNIVQIALPVVGFVKCDSRSAGVPD